MDTPQVGDVLESEDGTPMRVVDLGAPASPPGTGAGSSTPASPPSETGGAPQNPAPAEGTGTPAAPAQAAPPSQEQPAPGTSAAPEAPAPAPAPAKVEGEEVTPKESPLAAFDALLVERQEAADRRVAKVQQGLQKEINTQRDSHNQEVQALKTTLRDIRAQGVPEEDREALKRTWEIEDRESALEGRIKETDAQVKDLFVATLLHRDGFEDYGVTEEDLSALDDPDQMELFCKDAKIAYLEQHGGQPPSKAAGVTEAPKAAQPAPAPAAQPAPAGASAPADVGGTGATPTKEEFSTDQTPDAMAKNFSKLPKHRVRIA